MYADLILAVFFTLLLSGFSSMMEAALYAVPLSYVSARAAAGNKAAAKLKKLKENLSKPIAAIVITNTIANNFGAAYLGYATARLFGESPVMLIGVSAAFTVVLLYFSEIFPKMIGVMFCRNIAEYSVYPIRFLILLEYPLIYLSELVSRYLQRKGIAIKSSPQEILSMAHIGREEGVLDYLEGSVIKNVIELDEVFVRDILTPRVVVFRLDANRKVEDLKEEILNCHFSRIPVFDSSDPDSLIAYVTLRDLYRQFIDGDIKRSLKEMVRPLKTVPELMRVDVLMQQMFTEREQICAVVDEHGSLAGIITLEDILEEIVGREIVDEYDKVSDLRTYARVSRFTSLRKKQKRP